MSQSTEELLHRLSQDVAPVRPIPRLRSVIAGVVALWLLGAGVVALSGDLFANVRAGVPWRSPGFALALAGLLLTAAGASLASLAGAVPGREGLARRGRGVAVSGLLCASAGGAWAAIAATTSVPTPVASVFSCAGKATMMSLLPALLAALFLARGFGQQPLLGAAFALLGTVALGAVVVHLGCRFEAALHMLFAHALAPVFAAALLALPLAALVRWLARRRS